MAKQNRLKGHQIRWYVWVGEGEGRHMIPRESTMRGLWGYDVKCSCGWWTGTGGAVERYIRDEVWFHKAEHAEDSEPAG